MSSLIKKLSHAKALKQLDNGLLRVRGGAAISRRSFAQMAAGAGAVAAMGRPFAASASVEVNYMGWEGYDQALKADGFLDKNGIVLRTSYITGNEEIMAKASSGGKGSMDLVTPDGSHTEFMAQLGILQPLDTGKIPNLGGLFPEFANMANLLVDGKRYSVPFMWGSIPLMYNTEVVKDPPTSWMDLLKPEFKGKVGLVEDMISMVGDFALAATKAKIPTILTPEELQATFGLLKQIKKQQARAVAPTYGELATLFGTGEVVIAPAWQPVSTWAGDKVKLDFVTPKEGVWAFVDCYAMVAQAPNVDTNYKLINQAISPSGQASAANANLTACTAKDAVPQLKPEAKKIYPYDDIGSVFQKSGGAMYPLFPVHPDGQHATFDDVLAAWEDFLKA